MTNTWKFQLGIHPGLWESPWLVFMKGQEELRFFHLKSLV